MGVFLDPKLKKMKTFFDSDCRSPNLAQEGLAFFPVAKIVPICICFYLMLGKRCSELELEFEISDT